ncbi:DNA (cytosine-5-)-methyltransferase [Sarracenia purpurea var. burkii]
MAAENHRRVSPRLLKSPLSPTPLPSSRKQSPSQKEQETRISSKKRKAPGIVSFLVGDPVPDDEARRRWSWRYTEEVHYCNLTVHAVVWAALC